MYREMSQIFHGLRFIFILQWTKDMKDTTDPMNPKNTWVQWTPIPPNSSPLKIALPTSFGDPCDLSIIISWSDRQEPVPMLRKAKSKPKISSGDPWDLSINSWFDPLEFPRLRMRKNRTSFLCDPWNANILWCEDPENINQNAKTHFGFDPPGQAQCNPQDLGELLSWGGRICWKLNSELRFSKAFFDHLTYVQIYYSLRLPPYFHQNASQILNKKVDDMKTHYSKSPVFVQKVEFDQKISRFPQILS